MSAAAQTYTCMMSPNLHAQHPKLTVSVPTYTGTGETYRVPTQQAGRESKKKRLLARSAGFQDWRTGQEFTVGFVAKYVKE